MALHYSRFFFYLEVEGKRNCHCKALQVHKDWELPKASSPYHKRTWLRLESFACSNTVLGQT